VNDMGLNVGKCGKNRVIEFFANELEERLYRNLVRKQKKTEFKDINKLMNAVVFKCWGYEFLVSLCGGFSAWMMHMYPNCKTSFHCHHNKVSIIKVIEGSCLVETFFRNPTMVYEGDTVIFNKGVFHSEEAGPNGCKILQFESSWDKTDAVRFLDKHGKVGLPYEGRSKVVSDDYNKYKYCKGY